MRRLREVRGWSQRDLAAKSGVAQNTISQLERGERKAMPSTVRKLADALDVEPSVLLNEFEMARLMARGAQIVSQLPPEAREEFDQTARELDIEIERRRSAYERMAAKRQAERQFFGMEEGPGEREGRSGSEEVSPREEDLRNRYAPSRQPRTTSARERIQEEFRKEAARVRKEWRETGRWAEFFVSGELVKRTRAFAETHDVASYDFPFDPEQSEQTYLENIRAALRSVDYVADPVAVRSRLSSDDPKETVLAAQLVLDKAKRIVEEHEGYLESFRSIPERHYEDPEAHDRILRLERALSEQREAAAEDIQKLMDLYDECLDTLEDQILGMRKESDVLEEFVAQTHRR
jgi:transcriptional regulator with XRE-family HTH domain